LRPAMRTATTLIRCAVIRCFKMALDLTPSDRELCSQPTISRLENLPDARALLRIGRAMVDLYCESYSSVPKRIVLDIDDTFDAVHGGQQLRLFNAHYDEYGFQPIVVFDGEGRFITAVLRPAKRLAARRSRPFFVACCARSAPTGRGPKFSCAATAIIALPRFSTSVAPMGSITSLASRRHRRCAAISRAWKRQRRRSMRPPRQTTARRAGSRNSTTGGELEPGRTRHRPRRGRRGGTGHTLCRHQSETTQRPPAL